MTDNPDQQQLAREAKAIVALAFRNGPIEDIHAGKPCSTCSEKSGYSRISDSEMKIIMKNAVNRVYALLRRKSTDPDGYESLIAFGERYTAGWPGDHRERAGSRWTTTARATRPLRFLTLCSVRPGFQKT